MGRPLFGDHLPLSLAAHLARSQLMDDQLARYNTRQLFQMLDAVARALLKTARVHARDGEDAAPRELTPLELEGAQVLDGGRVVVFADGRKLATVSILRSELRDAIAVLRTVGIPELGLPTPEPAKPRRGETLDPAAALAELECLLRPPLVSPQLERANRILILLARNAKPARSANLAMQLMSALHDSRGKDTLSHRVPLLLAQLGAILRQGEDVAA